MKRNAVIVGVLGLGAVALACMPDLTDTVHFISGKVDFGAPPSPLIIAPLGETANRPTTIVGHDYSWVEQSEINKMWSALERAESDRNWAEARKVAQLILKKVPDDAETMRDRLEIYGEIAKRGVPADLPNYLTARAQKPDVKTLSTIAGGRGWLAPHAKYALAAVSYDNGKRAEAASLYEAAADSGSPRYEPALMMAARINLRDGATENQISHGEELLRRMLSERPNTRFRASINGWLLRVNFLRKLYADALVGYLGQIDERGNPDEQALVISSITMTANAIGPKDAKLIRTVLLAQPKYLEPYLNYRLYHSEAKKADLQQLANFAQVVLKKHPEAVLKMSTLARLAEISYLTGDHRQALSFANRSLAATGSDRRDLATYVKGASLAKLGRTDRALEAFAGFEKTYKGSYLGRAVRENRALLFEKKGEFGKALDEYFANGYRYDVAYLLDVRMTLNEVERYVQAHPSHRLKLALGYRLLRAEKYDQAAGVFASIPTKERLLLAEVSNKEYGWAEGYDKIVDPLVTAKDLSRLSEQARTATTHEATAAALYKLASYYYERRNLLLYNADLWKGMRSIAFAYFWNEEFAQPGDTNVVRRHHYEHECLMHAKQICLAIAKDYPRTKSAPKALYRAATASRRLANFNTWWRKEDRHQLLYRQAASSLRKLYTLYPNDPLAKKAKKYESVFISEGREAARFTMFEG